MAYTINRRLSTLVDSNGQLNTGKIPNDYITGDHIADNVITSAMLHTSFTVSTSNLTAIDTDDVSEGSSNLYYTDARARGAVSATGSISYNSSTGVFSFTQGDTDTISEGSTNLYFTNERVDDRVNALLTAGTGITLTYDDSANTLTIAGAAQYGDSDVESYLDANGITLPDSIKAQFGASNDLQIYHDGSNSYISDNGTGDLRLQGNGLKLINSSNLETYANFVSNGASTFYYDNSAKLATTSTGIDVTGAVVATSFSDGTISGITFIDEDSFATNSATRIPTQQSIKAYVDAEVAGVVDSAPAALDTLNELAAALGDDANFSTTTSTALGNRLRVDTAAQGLTGTQQANAITNLGITATKAELNYVDGVTSNIQTQLDAKLASSSYTAADVLTKIKTVDGAGSGLDADLLDGVDSASFLRSDTADTMTGALTIDVDNIANGALRINANQTNPDNDFYFGQEIVSTLSGSTATTGDREQGGLYLDINSTATGGDTSNEHRVYGIYSDVDSTGDSDLVYGGWFNATATPSTGQTSEIAGLLTVGEDNGGSGAVSSVFGIKSTARSDNSDSDTNNLYGVYGLAQNTADSGAITAAHGLYGEIEIPVDTPDIYGTSYVVRAEYDNNSTTAQTNDTYLYYGNYAGVLPTNPWGVYIIDDVTNYFNGSVGIGTNSTSEKLTVSGNIAVTGTVDGRDVATDGSKLDGIESGATADQTAAEILTAIKTVDGAGSGLDADLLDGISSASFLRSDTADTAASKITFNGIDFTSTTGTSETDLSKHIALYGTTYGFSITANNLNLVAAGTNTLSSTSGTLYSKVNHDFSAGIDVTGNITVSGTVDGRDIASDGSKLDGIESGATADQTAAEILTAIKTVDGAGSGLDADTLDGISSASFLRSDAGDSWNVGRGDVYVEDNSSDNSSGSGITLRTSNNPSSGDPASVGNIFAIRSSGQALRFAVGQSITSTGDNDFTTNDLTANGNITVTGTVDGRDIASDGSKLDGIASGATADQTITLSGDASGSGTTSIAVTVADDSHNHSSSSGDFTINGGNLYTTTSQQRVKVGVWSNTTYGIGMQAGHSFGGIASEYVLTNQMSNTNGRGFWWGDSAHTNAQGAMALTTQGYLTVASRIRVGYGESDTTEPSKDLDVSGEASIGSLMVGATTTPAMQLQVKDTTNYHGILVNGNAAPSVCFDTSTGTTPEWKVGISGNDATKFAISKGTANDDKLTIDTSGHVLISNDLYIPDQIIHTGDTNTYMQFHAADQWRVVTGGSERLEVNNTRTTVNNGYFQVTGSDSHLVPTTTATASTVRIGKTASTKSAIVFDTSSTGTTGSKRIYAIENSAGDRLRIGNPDFPDAFIVHNDGNVGIGTTSPTKGKLVVTGADYDEGIIVERTDTSSRWGLSGADSGSFQIWDDNQGDSTRLQIANDGETTIYGTKMNVISSAEAVMGAQSTGYSYWRVVADNSPNTYFQAGTGQTSSQVKMYFTGMFGSNNTMTVDTPNQRVGIGITGPGTKLDVQGTVRCKSGSSYNDISLSDELPGYGSQSYGNIKASTNNVYFSIGSSYVSYIAPNGSYNVSDLRLKENITDLTGSLDKILQLRGVNYTWKDTENRGAETHIGFIAQEVEEVIPELVGDGGLPIDEDGNEAYKNVNYANLVPVLVEAIKELKAENDALKARLDAGGL